MSNKRPMLICLVHGIVGAYMGYKKDPSGESDLVTPMYVPFNGFRTKAYNISVPKSSIIPIELPVSNIPGACTELVFITEDAKGNAPVADQLKGVIGDRLSEMREKIADQKLEIMTGKQRASDKSQESRKQIQEDQQLSGRRREPNPFGLGDSRFGEDSSDPFNRGNEF